MKLKLTDSFIKNIKASGKAQKYTDGGGLYLYVTPIGSKVWRINYRFLGKYKTFSLGSYPAISLKIAREKLNEFKALLVNGVDPAEHKKAQKASRYAEVSNSFELVAREWLEKYRATWSVNHYEKSKTRLENDIFPYFRNMGISSITPPMLLEIIRKIEARGAVDTAHRALGQCGQIFRYAVATGRAERDPSSDLRGALAPNTHVHYPSITEPKAIGVLLRDIEEYPTNIIIKSALRLAPYVFVRPSELRKAEWAEFNFENAEWRIPASRMKMRVLHIVPLSKQVLEILNELFQYTGDGRFLFPSMRSKADTISDATLLSALRRMGYDKDTMCVHGFRAMASTLLNEQAYNRDWIERQLAHGERDSIRSAYNYAEYLPERRKMMQEWADYLDSLRGNS